MKAAATDSLCLWLKSMGGQHISGFTPYCVPSTTLVSHAGHSTELYSMKGANAEGLEHPNEVIHSMKTLLIPFEVSLLPIPTGAGRGEGGGQLML